MIDPRLLKRLLAGAALVAALAAGASLYWGRPALAGGIALGFALGAAPFASWAWILSRGMSSFRNRALAAALVLLKLAAYSVGLFFLVTRKLVDPVGVFAAMTGVVAIVIVGSLAWGTA